MMIVLHTKIPQIPEEIIYTAIKALACPILFIGCLGVDTCVCDHSTPIAFCISLSHPTSFRYCIKSKIYPNTRYASLIVLLEYTHYATLRMTCWISHSPLLESYCLTLKICRYSRYNPLLSSVQAVMYVIDIRE